MFGAGMRLFACIVMCLVASAALADPLYDVSEFQAYERDGSIDFRAGNYTAAEEAFASAALYNPQQAKAYFNLAAAAARAGNRAKALMALDRFADFGVAADIASDADFASLRGEAEFARIRDKLARNIAPLCVCKLTFEGTAEPFIAEGLALDLKTERLFVSGVAARKIVAIHNGEARDFAEVPDGMSALGLHINKAHDLLWAAASVLPQSGDLGTRGAGELIAFDITSGAVSARYPAPPGDGPRSLSDLAIGPDGTIYVSDAIQGDIFRLKPGSDALEKMGDRPRFKSPQGMAVSADGATLLVADYLDGLERLDLASGTLDRVAVPVGVTTLGIDGLVELPNGSFAATQNGLSPNRVVHFRLTKDWSRLESFAVAARGTQVGDVSLLVPSGNDVLVAGTSQWDSYGNDSETPSKPLLPWRIVRVGLP